MLEQAHALPQEDMPLTADLTLRKCMVSIAPSITPYELKKFIEMFAEDTFRVKGFVRTTEGLVLADCVGNVVSVEPYAEQNVPPDRIGWLNILSGAGMPIQKALKNACEWYRAHIVEIA